MSEIKIKRIPSTGYIVQDDEIYRLYYVRLTWPDGKVKDFDSEEHAHAFLDDREPNWKWGMS